MEEHAPRRKLHLPSQTPVFTGLLVAFLGSLVSTRTLATWDTLTIRSGIRHVIVFKSNDTYNESYLTFSLLVSLKN
jgi:hypothetical protein